MAARKSRRRYDSPIRREQAAATRGSILDAAQRLFEDHGYAATSMAAIATAAGVSLKTVYVVFDTKSGVLRALWHLLLRGDEESVPMGDREWFREMLDEPDPRRQIRLVAENSRVVKARAGALIEVIRGAAVADPDIAELWSRIQSEFHPDPAKDHREPGREGRPQGGPRPGAGRRRPLGAQPPELLLAARQRARLDARGVRAVAGRGPLLRAPGLAPSAQAEPCGW